ncbi:hypothetical protein TWF694_009034 [Orbilia ellipsospora]|uniref:Uncharacterized protein n=1 Tax=Orbilia ellipsospora TaxID=2528407 RepID=A0AAV9XDN5_9PEZI
MDPNVSKPRKRAQRCPRLNEPEIGNEIEILYTVLQWKLDDIRTEINQKYDLNATQRASNREYKKVYQDLILRDKLGKESEVTIGGIVTIPRAKVDRWISRNITFTAKMIPDARTESTESLVAETSEHFKVQVRTPQASEQQLNFHSNKRYIPASVLSKLPIFQASQPLNQFISQYLARGAQARGKSSLSSQYLHPHYSLLRGIIYQISNQMIGPYEESLQRLLDRVDELGAREALKSLLSNNTPSIVATCESLLVAFYLRDNTEMLRFVSDLHPSMTIPLYSILNFAVSSYSLNRPLIARILKDLEEAVLVPKSEDLINLLFASKEVLSDISVFVKLWDQKAVSARDIEEALIEKKNFINLRFMPLHTNNPILLKQLLTCGFTENIPLLTLVAILKSKTEIAMIFFGYLGVSVNLSEPQIWDRLCVEDFYRIIQSVVADDNRYWDSMRREESLLVYLGCLKTEMLDYVIRVLEWKTTTNRSDAALTVIDFLPFKYPPDIPSAIIFDLDPSDIRNATLSVLPALKKLLGFGVDPNRTSLWRGLIWENLVEHGVLGFVPVPQTLEALVDAGADIEMTFSQSFVTNLNITLQSPTLEVSRPGRSTAIKPLDIALLLKDSAVFCFLVLKSKDVDGFLQNIALVPEEEFVLLPHFVHAVRDRNCNLIREMWDVRFENPERAITLALEKEQVDVAREVILRYRSTWKLISLVLQVAHNVREGRVREFKQYNCGLEVLQSLAVEGINFQEFPEFQLHPLLDEYKYALQSSIESDKLELLKILLDLGTRGGDGIGPSIYLGLQYMASMSHPRTLFSQKVALRIPFRPRRSRMPWTPET